LNTTSFIGLVQNAALLLAIALIFDLISPYYADRKAERSWRFWLRQVAFSLLLGCLGLVVMMTPWRLTPEIEIDARTVILSISGIFFGIVPTIVAVSMMVTFRIFEGGIALWASLLTMLSTSIIGMVWGYFHRGNRADISWRELYLLGLVTHYG
jgi:hypothetical protein